MYDFQSTKLNAPLQVYDLAYFAGTASPCVACTNTNLVTAKQLNATTGILSMLLELDHPLKSRQSGHFLFRTEWPAGSRKHQY